MTLSKYFPSHRTLEKHREVSRILLPSKYIIHLLYSLSNHIHNQNNKQTTSYSISLFSYSYQSIFTLHLIHSIIFISSIFFKENTSLLIVLFDSYSCINIFYTLHEQNIYAVDIKYIYRKHSLRTISKKPYAEFIQIISILD